MKLEDLKVGQYVRFKDKKGNTYIRKIKEVCTKNPEKMWGAIIIDKNANNVPYVSLKNITKASYNIIDILEEGDYVNGREVVDIFYNSNDEIIGIDTRGSVEYVNSQIKSIVTKEQMEQMAYKVEE